MTFVGSIPTLASKIFLNSPLQENRALEWCEAVALAVHEAIAYKPDPPSNDVGQFIPAPQSRLMN
jgi:hypothetical protein